MKMNQDLIKKLWASAESMRGNVSSEEYMYIVIGIMFIKHMSDKYNKAVKKIEEEYGPEAYDILNNKDILFNDYNTSFIVPEKANWNYISQFAASPEIGEVMDNAFELIEDSNPELLGLFEKRYNREELDQSKLGIVVSDFSNIDFEKWGEDVIGRTYEYFLGKFFIKQGQSGGEFYTPKSIVDLMVKIISPSNGKLYDPTAGTGGMLVQARQHIIDTGGDPSGLVVYGQEYQNKTWKLSRINLLLHGFSSNNINMGSRSADTIGDDLHKNEKFDFVLANPPFNVKKWAYEETANDVRWKWGRPPKGNANLAFISHMISKLNTNGRGASVLANGELSSSGKEAVMIREAMIRDNVIEAIISLPDKLFYTTGIPASIWVFNRNKSTQNVLMIDASRMEGKDISRKVRKLTNAEIETISKKYSHFKSGENVDELGFSKSVNIDELIKNNFSFVPGRYVGYEEENVDENVVKEQVAKASSELFDLINKFEKLMPSVKESIKKINK